MLLPCVLELSLYRPVSCSVSSGRRVLPPLALGSLGVAALLMQPIPSALLAVAPELQALPALAQRALLALNPLLLVIVASLVGTVCAYRVGLRSVLGGTAARAGEHRVWIGSAALGLIVGAAVWALDALWLPWLGDGWRVLAQAQQSTSPWQRLALGMLYGGMTEEILARWGLMSLLLWSLSRCLGPARMRWSVWSSIVLSALAFGCAHLPALALQVDMDAMLVVRTLLLNGLGGVLYGWLFWRYHLEAAMASHAASHVALVACQLGFG
ncbi:CPBP family intramembrane metalloprotease [Salmonella enterica]|nr:CPBP family intramembrane metalloprotease [Salmonella enterica]EDY7090914.1 CPBP family intramembrane metalloprotease [Salmonella enterica subsp. enterica serovar Litchfield]ECL6702965.1 CPBP family intramembrane metalloprotease [Salmonella enterica]EEU8963550.1 CPBP family intramembrane metalloprotease [Salmonella enterica]EJC1988099.1 CPBP family intramembrane metalloprotease [Salmonella enterica subsp. enterica serovar Litchfield]